MEAQESLDEISKRSSWKWWAHSGDVETLKELGKKLDQRIIDLTSLISSLNLETSEEIVNK